MMELLGPIPRKLALAGKKFDEDPRSSVLPFEASPNGEVSIQSYRSISTF
jgi:hypothetical protein